VTLAARVAIFLLLRDQASSSGKPGGSQHIYVEVHLLT
jgi:hypothetical protein